MIISVYVFIAGSLAKTGGGGGMGMSRARLETQDWNSDLSCFEVTRDSPSSDFYILPTDSKTNFEAN